MSKKSGFGLMEVMAAAVVLGFLLVGLSVLQKGNRESVLRVRARDAANIIAQHVLDSLGSIGKHSLVADANGFIVNKTYIYNFEGKPQLDKNTSGISIEVPYTVKVKFAANSSDADRRAEDITYFTIANRQNANIPGANEINQFTESLEATVSWPHKKTEQSIKVAKVVR